MAGFRIPVLVGSVRQGRQSIRVARWVVGRLTEAGAEPELIDPLELDLPLLRHRPPERYLPVLETLSHKLRAMDGLFIVTPEYNHGYPPALKNTLDHFYEEYEKKPVAIASVSSGPSGGARVVEQLKPILVEYRMVPIRNSILVRRVQDRFDQEDRPLSPELDQAFDVLWEEFEWYLKVLREGRERYG